MKLSLETILKAITKKAAGILDAALIAILLVVLQKMSILATQEMTAIASMIVVIILMLLITLLSSYILLYKRLKLVAKYLKIQGTSWETVEDTVEFSNAFDEAISKEKR